MALDPREVAELKYYNLKYRSGSPEISDHEYDMLYSHAKKLYPTNEFFNIAQPEVEEIKYKCDLPIIMGSLDNYELDTTKKWLQKYPCDSGYVAMYKLDGISCCAEYKNGILTFAATRGNGTIGQNILEKAKIFCPNTLQHPDDILIKGEIILNYDPEKLGYKNRRNAVAGIINSDNATNCEYLKLIVFELIRCPDRPKSESDRLKKLKTYGFDVVPYVEIHSLYTDKIPSILENMIVKFKNNVDRPYDIDGAVLCPDNYELENVQYPKRKIAYKKKNEEFKTEVLSVTWETSRNGRVIPVANFKPINIDGSTISKATAFHAGFVAMNHLKPGKIIRVCKSKEVIPMILDEYDPETSNPDFTLLPNYCPCCNKELTWDVNHVHIKCTNSDCTTKIYKRITHFFISLGLQDFTEKSFESLDIRSITQAYTITESDICKVSGWAEKSAKSFVEGIRSITHVPSDKFICALGIDSIGKVLSKKIAKLIMINDKSYSKFIDFTCIDGISEVRSRHINLGLKECDLLIKEACKYITIVDDSTENQKLLGFKFCITGSLLKPRKEIEKLIEDNGGQVVSSIKRELNFYLIANQESDSSKYVTAKKFKSTIITEEQFYKMLSND